MVVFFAGCLIILHSPPHYPDRAAFLKTLAALPSGTPKEWVAEFLGAPDRIVRKQPLKERGKFYEEIWLYGTDGSKGAASLAQVPLFLGKLGSLPHSPPPPPQSVISEGELRKGLHLILDSIPKDSDPDGRLESEWLARSVNQLLPFGEAKCKAILSEFGRITGSVNFMDPRPYELCFSLFDPPSPPGYFELGPWSVPDPSIKHVDQPRWPITIVNNVPIVCKEEKVIVSYVGPPFTFATEFEPFQGRIHLRKSPLSPPKDLPVKVSAP